MREALICDAVRTPVGRRGGALSSVHPVDLSAHVLRALVERNDLRPEDVDDVVWGCVNQIGEQAGNVGRLAVLAAGWPERIPGVTVDRACGSSQQALHFAAALVMSGQAEVVITGGVESMSKVPLGAARAVGEPFGPKVAARYGRTSFSQGEGAETIARRWGLTRTDVDQFALDSHARAAQAIDSGVLADHLIPVEVDGALVEHDEGIRRGGTLETLGALTTPFDPEGVVTAGNASQISDGAGALLITHPDRARELGLRPLARFHTGVAVGDDPVTMLTAPIPATELVLRRAGLSIDDIGVFEVNEAFASVPLAWQLETGVPSERLNPWGGAIAIGHPLGGSGAILMSRLVHQLRRSGQRFGLQTMCEAGGMANATIVERIDA